MTKKPFKVLSASALAAVFTVSAIAPAAVFAAETPAALSISDYIVEKDDVLYSFDLETYKEMKLGGVETPAAKYVKTADGKVYSLSDYLEAKGSNVGTSVAEALTILAADSTADKDITYGNVTFGEDGKPTYNPPATTELKVESVKAINPTSIQVTFNNDLTAEQAAKENFALSKGTVEAVAVTGKVATIAVKGLTYGNETTVTVGNPAHTATVTVPQVSDLFALDIQTDAPDDTIKSDGSTKTQITVTLKDKLTGETVTDKDGILQFQATRGGLGQTTSALQNGVATVQLTSEASAVSHTSIVTVTVSNVPGAAEFEGLTGQKAVIFSPDGAKDPGQVKFVTAVSADSSQGDRLFVVFSDEIKAADYKKAIADKAAVKGAPTSVEYGINVNGHPVAVSDVVQKTPTTLEFILDTDVVGNATTADYDRIEAGWNGAATGKNYLRDNVEHTVTFPNNVGNLVLANTTGSKFILTDTSKPGVLGVSAKDQLEFSVRFTESMDETTIEKLDGNKNPNFLLDGREVLVIASPGASQIAAAKAANQVILTSLQVGNYSFLDKDGKPTTVFANAVNAVDTRNVTTFKVHKDFALANGVHQIQIAKVGDWAQDVDPAQNLIATDTFDFTVKADDSVPAATIEVQSAEQWKVSFDKEVYGVTGKTIKEVFSLKSADANDTFTIGNAPGTGVDYIVSWIDEKGETGGVLDPAANASTLDGKKHFLIEFTQDWTVKYDTAANPLKTYFASTKNPYIVTLDHLESAIGNKLGKKELDVKLSYDGVSPKIDKAEQLKTTQGAFESKVRVVMTEPVKNVAGNNEGLTPSQSQAAGAGVPEPTYEFVKGDKVVKATASAPSYDNKAFTLSPVGGATLEAGEWTLFIRSISDDIGNTSATESHNVTIKAAEQEATGTRLAWAAFDDALGTGKLLNDDIADNFDVIYVKFTKEMKADGANGVSRSQNYVFMGQPLPEGSTVQRGIVGVTNDWDGVTLLMPKGTWNGTNSGNDFTNNLNIASNFVSADGETLSGKYAVELTDPNKAAAVLHDEFEAIYTDAGEQNKPNQVTFAGKAQVTGATVKTAGIVEGKINEIELTLDKSHGVIAPGTEVFVNGKTFEVGVAAAGVVTLTAKTATERIDGTATNNLKITGKDGSIIVNTGSVKDEAAPVITSAELNAAKDKVTLTFSEAVTNATDGTFEKVLATAFEVGGTVATAVEHDAATPNKVVLSITNGATLDVNSTVAATATAVQDFAKATTPATVWTVAFSPIKGALLAGPAAPTVVGGQTIITGIVAGLEYKLDSATTWTPVTPAQVTAGEVTGLAAGDYNVRVAQTATQAASAVTTVTVTPSLTPSTIVFADGATVAKTFGDPAFTNAVSGDGAGTVTYTSGTPGVATVNSTTGQVTIVGVGSTEITASKAATATHAATTATYTVNVTAAPVTAIAAITGTSQVGQLLTAGALTPAAATATYQWQIADTAGGTFADIDGATTSTYTPVLADETKFIRVVVTGTGNYTGTATSAETTAVAAQ